MTSQQIALKERINELRAKQRKYGKWETEKAFEIQALIRQQAILEDEIMVLEWDLSKLPAQNVRLQSDDLWNVRKILGGLGL